MFIDFQLLETQHAMDEDRRKSPRKRGFSKRSIHQRIKDVLKRRFSALSTIDQVQLSEKEPAWKAANNCITQTGSCGKVSAT
jgi:hypothetical protein